MPIQPPVLATRSTLRLLSVLLLACATTACEEEGKAAHEPVPASVSVVKAQSATLSERLIVSGAIMARDPVTVSAEVSGLTIVELRADEGDRVEKGQVLALLSRDAILAELAQASAKISEAEARLTQTEMDQRQADRALERANQLRPDGAISVQRIEEADTAAQVAKGRVLEARQVLAGARAGKRAQEIKLAHTRIEAPMAGIVSRRPARLGALSDGAPLFQLVGKGELELVGTVAQSAMVQIEAGQEVFVTLTGGREFNGRVRQVAPAIDTSSQLGTVRIALPDAADIPIGAAAIGVIETGRNSGVTVPQTSLLFESGGVFVFTVTDGEARRRPIVLGPVVGGRARVLSGLGMGEAVVALAGAFLRDGDPVTAVLAPADAGDPS